MVNAVEYTFDVIDENTNKKITIHQLFIFHCNMNITSNIKKKWKKTPANNASTQAAASVQAAAGAAETPNRISAADILEMEESDHDLKRLNAPARGEKTMPNKIPDVIDHTRQGLFDLGCFMEYSKQRKVYEQAWKRIRVEFSDQCEIIVYLKTYYVDEKEKIVAKWAGHKICLINNQGLRTTSSTEAAHRKIKGFLRYGFGSILRLADCVDIALEGIAKAVQEEESRQIGTQLAIYSNQKWMGELPHRCALPGLKLLKQAYDWAVDEHTSKSPRTNCYCTQWEQYRLRCKHWVRDNCLEGAQIMKREDIGDYWWLERDLADYDPLIAVGGMAKATKLPGRPRGTGPLSSTEHSVRGQAVMASKTSYNTTSLGKKNRTGAGSASVTRVLSGHEYNSSSLIDLDAEDDAINAAAEERDDEAINALTQGTRKKRGRPPGSKNKPKSAASSVPPSATPDPTATPPAKRRYKKKKTVNGDKLSHLY